MGNILSMRSKLKVFNIFFFKIKKFLKIVNVQLISKNITENYF